MADAAARELKILVVDDDAVDRRAVRRALAKAGVAAEVRDAGAVLPAINLLATESFDCVFLDFNLPDGDGLTFLRGVRAAGISTPVVMLTGQQDERLEGELAASGAADYIAKAALTPARLCESLQRALPGWTGTAPPNR